ncbi:polymer-forming cytoskeletal protein [Halalkalirubrum salinum]|uniref:polymer-forming cytoskeletal protein n=1 Tax=Halalkalirubrum salinum TaxID=2563889 RepID=UPI0010FAEAFF|nr:polymer-forming cytoskeletal protein [Halalkalirubrum salinum]
MSSRVDPLNSLQLSDGTTVEEHDIVTTGDVLIGRDSEIELGIRGRTVAAGEDVSIGGSIEADDDCRLDTFCHVDGSVLVGADAYVGERVRINGRLLVSGDLDVGDDVEIDEGFEANGWIVIRNPIPVYLFYFIVLSHLLRLGDQDAAEEFASALAGEEVEEVDPVTIPAGSVISDDRWLVDTPATIGDDCRIHGNINAESIDVGERNTIFGGLTASGGDVSVGAETEVIGTVRTTGSVTLHPNATVRGNVEAGDLTVYEGAYVTGSLQASGEMQYITPKRSAPASDSGDSRDTADSGEPDGSHDAPDSGEPVQREGDAGAGDDRAETETTDDDGEAVDDDGEAEAVDDDGEAEAVDDDGEAEAVDDDGEAEAVDDGGEAETVDDDGATETIDDEGEIVANRAKAETENDRDPEVAESSDSDGSPTPTG